MAEKGKSGKSGGGRKKVTGKALKYLWASGVLKRGKKGKGGKRKTIVDRKRSKQLGRLKKRGVDTTKKYRNTPSGSTRPVIGGSKAAGLRSGAGSGVASKPSRAERIAAGSKALHPRAAAYAARKASMTPEQARSERVDRQFKGLQKAHRTMQSRNGDFVGNFGRGSRRIYSTKELDRAVVGWQKSLREKQSAWEKRSGTWMSKYRPKS